MMDGVARSRVFLLYMTRGVFTRPFCQKELREALRLRKPILLLWETEECGQIYKDASGAVQHTVASLNELRAEMPRMTPASARGEFEHVLDTCVAVTAQFHADALVREAMLDAICMPQRHAFVVPV